MCTYKQSDMSTVAAMTRLVLVGIVPLVVGGELIQQKALRGGSGKLKVGTPSLVGFTSCARLL